VNQWAVSASLGTGTVTGNWLPVTTANTNLVSTSSTATNQVTSIAFGVKVDVAVAAGTYSGSITITTIAKLPPTPTITSISPSEGIAPAGSEIVITGTNLSSTYQLLVDGVNCLSPNLVSNTQVKCKTPARSSGATIVAVSLSTWGGSTSSNIDYCPAATVLPTPLAQYNFTSQTTLGSDARGFI
jgi:hypothetical protein